MGIFNLFVVLLYLLAEARTEVRGLTSLRSGRSLSVKKESDFLISPNGTFSSGFRDVGRNAYCYSIWYTNSVKTIVWMANRDRPVNGERSKLVLHRNGNMVLADVDGSIVWSTNTFSEAHVEARLLETGNFVLINHGDNIIWESFNFPTDTLLPGQPLVRNTTLVSMRGEGTYLSGYYNLKFNDNNVLTLVYKGPLVSSMYWPTGAKTVFYFGRIPYNSSRIAFLDYLGMFRSSDNWTFNASNYGAGPKRRLTLDYDGVLRLYSLDESTGLWEMSWFPSRVCPCKVHGLCGPYGICSYNPLPTCSCPHGFFRNDPSDWSKGCSPLFNLTCNQTELDFVIAPNTDYFGNDLSFGTGMSLETCRNICLNDCTCQGFGYSLDGQGLCYLKGNLLNGYHLLFVARITYIKIPRRIVISRPEQGQVKADTLNCSAAKVVLFGGAAGGEDRKGNRCTNYLIAFVGSIGTIEIIFIGFVWLFVLRKHVREELVNMSYIVLAVGFKRFTFAELKRATQNFKQEIGKGGFGTVYRGILDNERVIAVKRLEGILQGDAGFWAEVSIIGKLNHGNLVKIWGFCSEGKHKLLVYDYMENGSLDKILFSDSSKTLSWDQRYNIALGTAKGLSYIHEECLEWVLHCDIKPENILLDDDLEPKVTDFGLSKLFNDNLDSRFSRIRGTRGYLAPEWMMNLNINAKADVYSYGIVLLELLSGKRASRFQLHAAEENEYNHLVQWVTEKIEQGRLQEVVDPRLDHNYEDVKLERLVRIALLCVREDRASRPPMSKVVELLTGNNKSNIGKDTDD